jgi:hypothetical protein
MVAFRVALGQGGQPSWWLYGANDELLAWAGRNYVSLAFARYEAAAFQSAARRVEYQIYPHPDGGWGWRAVQPVDYYMAHSAGGFTKPAEARRAAKKVKALAQRASGL